MSLKHPVLQQTQPAYELVHGAVRKVHQRLSRGHSVASWILPNAEDMLRVPARCRIGLRFIRVHHIGLTLNSLPAFIEARSQLRRRLGSEMVEMQVASGNPSTHVLFNLNSSSLSGQVQPFCFELTLAKHRDQEKTWHIDFVYDSDSFNRGFSKLKEDAFHASLEASVARKLGGTGKEFEDDGSSRSAERREAVSMADIIIKAANPVHARPRPLHTKHIIMSPVLHWTFRAKDRDTNPVKWPRSLAAPDRPSQFLPVGNASAGSTLAGVTESDEDDSLLEEALN